MKRKIDIVLNEKEKKKKNLLAAHFLPTYFKISRKYIIDTYNKYLNIDLIIKMKR